MSGDYFTAAEWGDHVLHLLKQGSYEDAVSHAAETVANLKTLRSGFLTKLFEISGSVNNSAVQDACRRIAIIASQHCPVDEVVFELVDCSHEFSIWYLFETALDCFQVLFHRERKEMHLDWCLSMIRIAVKRFANEDAEDSDSEKRFAKLKHSMREIIRLFEPLNGNEKALFICTLLDFVDNKYPVFINQISEFLLCQLQLDPFGLVDVLAVRKLGIFPKNISRHLLSGNIASDKSLASFFHCALRNKLPIVPQIYSHTYRLISSIPFINILLLDDNDLRGLELLEMFCQPCQGILSNAYLTGETRQVLQNINKIMVFNQKKELRQRATYIFSEFIHTFSEKGLYYLMLYYRQDINNSATLTYFLCLIKKKYLTSRSEGSEYFQGKRLLDLFKAYSVDHDKDVDVLDYSDQIMAWLNFFWLLVTENRKTNLNMTGLEDLKSTHVLPLQKLVDEALERIEKQAADFKDGKNTELPEFALQLSLPKLNNDEKLQSLLQGRTTINLMQSTIQWVLDLWMNE